MSQNYVFHTYHTHSRTQKRRTLVITLSNKITNISRLTALLESNNASTVVTVDVADDIANTGRRRDAMNAAIRSLSS
jgi:hypothetical protein